MALYGEIKKDTRKAEADLSAKQYFAMAFGTNADEVNTAGANAVVAGVLLNKPDTAGDPAVIATEGVVKLVVDGNAGAISKGSYLETDSSGRGVATTTDNNNVFARALETSSAQGDIIRVELFITSRY